MNNINTLQELENLVVLMQEALKFYANANNYKGNKNICCSGISVSLVEMDEGSQARFAIDSAKNLIEQNQKMQNEYDKLIAEGQITNLEDIEQMIMDSKNISNQSHNE
jgi:hypothetical protein